MINAWWHLLMGFFVANVLGYGGGPSTIPLIQSQVVHHYHFESNAEFTNLLAIANALPGPIATKLAAAIGFQVGGITGVIVATVATVVPSAVILVLLLRVLNRFRTSPVVKGMTLLILPVISVLMLLLTWEVFGDSRGGLGVFQTLLLMAVVFLLMQWRKVHPAFIIVGAFAYGGLVVPLLGRF